MMKANRLKHGGSTYSQADNAMPLSEPMKAAILLAIMLAILAAVGAMVAAAGMAIANAIEVLTSAVKAEAIGNYAGVGGFFGGLFEDRLDLD